MQTLTLSCSIQQTAEGEGAQHQGLAAAQIGAWVGFVWAGFGVSRLPEVIPVSAKIQVSQLQHPMETHSGAVDEGLQPLGRTRVGNVCGIG